MIDSLQEDKVSYMKNKLLQLLLVVNLIYFPFKVFLLYSDHSFPAGTWVGCDIWVWVWRSVYNVAQLYSDIILLTTITK